MQIIILTMTFFVMIFLPGISNVLKADAGPAIMQGGPAKRLSTTTPILASAKTFEAPFSPRRTVKVCRSDCDYKSPSQAMANAQDYDLIEVEAGTYADCAVIPASIPHIWIRGTGGMAHMKGVVCEQQGAFVVNATQTVIENFEFSNLRIACAAGQNAVGIRLQAGDLAVRNSYFHDSQGGILTANNGSSRVAISNSHFARLGTDITKCESNPFTWFHNLYIGSVASLALRNSIVADNPTGNLVKSRAQRSIIDCNVITNGYDPSYIKRGFLIDLPQGGDALITNNLIAQGPLTQDQQIMVAYGAEIQASHPIAKPNNVQQLKMSGNILLNDLGKGTFVQLYVEPPKPAALTRNRFIGTATLIGGFATSVVEDHDDVFPTRSQAGVALSGLLAIPSGCSGQVGPERLKP